MPKETFFNLPEEKSNTIQETALKEFAEHGFKGASINRIVASAAIAKGSFYQYFDNKADLYNQIIAYIGKKKMAYVSPVLMNPAEHDFFTLLEEIYRSGLKFAQDYPLAAKLGYEVFKNKSNPIFSKLLEESRQQANQFFEPLLNLAIERGEVDPDIDKAFIIYMIIQMQLASLDYYVEICQPGGLNEDYMPTVRVMINFIRNGIGTGPTRSDAITKEKTFNDQS